MKILIVDDIEDSRIYLERGLKSQGYTVMTASDGETALAKAREWKPNIIISDILMPKMDGFELCRKVKSDNTLKRICFVFYTATFVEKEDEKLAMALGASKFIVKPIEPEEFFRTIKAVIDNHNEMNLPVPESLNSDEEKLEQMYSVSISRKLEKKVSELEKEKDAFQQSERKYRRLVESLQEEYFLYSLGIDGVFTYVSPSIKNVLGYSQDEYLKHYTNYLTGNLINKDVKRHVELSIRGKVQPSFPVEIYHKNGNLIWLESRETPVFDKRGDVIGVEGIAHDVTKRIQAEKKIEQSLHEKELLLQEVYHRTRNNMLVICSLINQQSDKINIAEARNAFKKLENEIHFMALVHQKLYESQNLNEINMKDYIKDMTKSLLNDYCNGLDKINFELYLEDVYMSIDEAIPCSLLFHELISNAINHAFPDSRNGVIKLYLSNTKEGAIKIRVKDDGIGLLLDFDAMNAKTTGMQTIMGLAEYQLKGKVEFLVDDGVDFQLLFKKNKRKERI